MADTPFEVPQSMRDASERNLKQAHAVYEQIMDFMTKAMDAWTGAMPENPVTAGFKDVQEQVMEFVKENAEAAFALGGKISTAPTLQDVLLLQTRFAQDRLQTFVAQTQQLFSVFEETFQNSERGAMGASTDIPATRPNRNKKNLFN